MQSNPGQLGELLGRGRLVTKVLRGQQSIQFTASNNLDAIQALYPEDISQYSEYECQF